MKGLVSRIFKIAGTLLFVLYPFGVYYLITRYDTRTAGIFILVILGINYGPGVLKSAESRKMFILQGLAISLVILISMWINSELILVHLPVCINFFLLVSFAYTLYNPPSMIERYARPFIPDLSDEEIVYCRNVTILWIIFFILNFIAIESIIIFGTTRLWALYTGLIAYVLMGLTFSAEYIYRKIRFKRFANHPLDRFLALLIGR